MSNSTVFKVDVKTAGVKELETIKTKLKGLGKVMKLPLSFITTAISTYTSIEFSLDYIPTQVKTYALMGIIALVVFLVISLLKGEPNML